MRTGSRFSSRYALAFLGFVYLGSLLLAPAMKVFSLHAIDLFSLTAAGYLSLGWFDLACIFLLLPLSFLALIAVWIFPGLFLVSPTASDFHDLVHRGFIVSFIVQFGVFLVVTLVSGPVVNGTFFLIATASAGFLSWLYAYSKSDNIQWSSLSSCHDLTQLAVFVALPFFGFILLHPYILWQSLNPDGLEALILGDSLNYNVFPRLTTVQETVPVSTGIISPSYLFNYFIQFVGKNEVSVRLPFLFLLSVLFLQICQLIEIGQKQRIRLVVVLHVIGVLSIFALAACFSAGYDFYSADIAAPASEDVFVLVGVSGFLLAAIKRKWMIGFCYLALGVFARPTMIPIALVIVTVIVFYSRDRRLDAFRSFSTVGFVLTIALLYQVLHVAPSSEPGSSSFLGAVLERVRYLSVTDYFKVGIFVIGAGILPFFALFILRLQDTVSKAITAFVLLNSGFLYFMAFTALHHYFAAMVFPLVVFWRILWPRYEAVRHRFALVLVLLSTVLFSLWQSFPSRLNVERQAHIAGSQVYFPSASEGEFRMFDDASNLLAGRHVSYDWFADYTKEYFTWPLVPLFYADREGPLLSRHRFALLRDSETPPVGFAAIEKSSGFVLYGRVPDADLSDTKRLEHIDYRSPVYAIPFNKVFSYRGLAEGSYDFDLYRVKGAPRRVLDMGE